MNRTIITVVGKDTVGIIAKVCTYLSDYIINILDNSHNTLHEEYFNMMMIVDMGKMTKSFEEVADELANVGKELGVQVKCQREEIFNMMHRI
ncbi:MAG: ACT domain-containing protein [Segatella copri]